MFDPSNVVFGAARPRPGFHVVDFSDNPRGTILSGEAAESFFASQVLTEEVVNFLSTFNFDQGFDRAAILPKPANWPVKDQSGTRGTCTAFNMLAAVEMVAAQAGNTGPLSEEFLYSKMRREYNDLSPDDQETGATFLSQAVAALKGFGVCSETRLRYQGPKSHPAWSAKDVRQLQSHAYRPDLTLAFPFWRPEPINVAIMAQTMLRYFKRPICVSLPIYPEGDITPWTYGIGWDTGFVPYPAYDRFGSKPEDEGGHSFCIVGHVPDPSQESFGWYIFRNSWGEGFGRRPSPHPVLGEYQEAGYGALSAKHLHDHCWEMLYWPG